MYSYCLMEAGHACRFVLYGVGLCVYIYTHPVLRVVVTPHVLCCVLMVWCDLVCVVQSGEGAAAPSSWGGRPTFANVSPTSYIYRTE